VAPHGGECLQENNVCCFVMNQPSEIQLGSKAFTLDIEDSGFADVFCGT